MFHYLCFIILDADQVPELSLNEYRHSAALDRTVMFSRNAVYIRPEAAVCQRRGMADVNINRMSMHPQR